MARATLRTSAALALRLAVQAGGLLVIARLLGPARYGAFAGVASLAVMLGSLSTFGTHLILLRETSQAPGCAPEILPFALGTTLTLGTLLLFLFLAIAQLALGRPELSLTVLVCIGAAELLLQPLLLFPVAEHQGEGRIARSQLLMIAPLALRLVVALIVWASRPTQPLLPYAWGYLLSSLLATTWSWRTTGWQWKSLTQWRMPSWIQIKDASGFAALNLTALGSAELDKTVALRLMPLAAVGVYVASARVIGAIALPVVALMLAALPRLFRSANQTARPDLLRTIFAVSLLYGLVAGLGIWMAAPVIERLLGSGYKGAAEVLRVLAVAVPGMALRVAAGSSLMARGHPWMRAAFELAGIAVLVLAATGLMESHPRNGMSLALVCSEWSMTAVGWLMLSGNRPVGKQMSRSA